MKNNIKNINVNPDKNDILSLGQFFIKILWFKCKNKIPIYSEFSIGTTKIKIGSKLILKNFLIKIIMANKSSILNLFLLLIVPLNKE